LFTGRAAESIGGCICLSTLKAGRVNIGTDAHIGAGCVSRSPAPAKVVFIATQAQFTPKMVETQTERDKLMFRIRVRIKYGRHLRRQNGK